MFCPLLLYIIQTPAGIRRRGSAPGPYLGHRIVHRPLHRQCGGGRDTVAERPPFGKQTVKLIDFIMKPVDFFKKSTLRGFPAATDGHFPRPEKGRYLNIPAV